MSTGYILIVAILILGGVIATVGDRLGTKVGKARLSLFNLRPRKTAVLVTILTGSIISASTLAVLLTVDDQLYQGIFELRKIQNQLSRLTKEYETAVTQKNKVDSELAKAKSAQVNARRSLNEINQSLNQAIARQSLTQTQLNRTRGRLSQIATNFQQAQSQLKTVSQQASNLRSEITQLQTERQTLLQQQEQVREQIARRDQEIVTRDRAIALRENRLRELEAQQDYLGREVDRLEQEAQGLRQGNLALQRGQVLASGVVRIVEPTAAQQAVDQLLVKANQAALQATRPGINSPNAQTIQITKAEVDQLVDEIDDGQDYVIRILSAANYLVGETPIQVFADAVRNQVVFLAGDVVAANSVTPSTMTSEQIQQQINLLLAASSFRARRLGMLNDTVQIGRIQTVIDFIERLKQYQGSVDMQTVTAEVTYTAGPLKIRLVAVQNGQVLFTTQ